MLHVASLKIKIYPNLTLDIFCDIFVFFPIPGNEVSDEHLTRAFGKYPSFQKAKVVRDKRTNKSRGFGFVSFKDPQVSDFGIRQKIRQK